MTDASTAPHVFISGITSGIGAALADKLYAAGWNVSGIARREALLQSRQQRDPERYCLEVADVCDPQAVTLAMSFAIERFGNFTAVIANAGIGYEGSLIEQDPASVEKICQVNIQGVHHCVKFAVPHCVPGSRIQIVSSIVGLLGLPGMGIYPATKFAVQGYAESLRAELMPLGISVTTINPGTVATDFFEQAGDGDGPRWSLRPKKVLTADEVADAMVTALLAKRTPKTVVRPHSLQFVRLLRLLCPPLYRYIQRRGVT